MVEKIKQSGSVTHLEDLVRTSLALPNHLLVFLPLPSHSRSHPSQQTLSPPTQVSQKPQRHPILRPTRYSSSHSGSLRRSSPLLLLRRTTRSRLGFSSSSKRARLLRQREWAEREEEHQGVEELVLWRKFESRSGGVVRSGDAGAGARQEWDTVDDEHDELSVDGRDCCDGGDHDGECVEGVEVGECFQEHELQEEELDLWICFRFCFGLPLSLDLPFLSSFLSRTPISSTSMPVFLLFGFTIMPSSFLLLLSVVCFFSLFDAPVATLFSLSRSMTMHESKISSPHTTAGQLSYTTETSFNSCSRNGSTRLLSDDLALLVSLDFVRVSRLCFDDLLLADSSFDRNGGRGR